jgi:DNA-binding transcriptional LysR family regulator
MELRHLRYFVTVSELGSMSRAAEKLFIAQPPFSTQIQQLEDEVGVKLLVRYPRGVRQTDVGSAFLSEAKDLLARSERVRTKRLARHNHSSMGGVIRIGYVSSAGHTALPRLLCRIREIRLGRRDLAGVHAVERRSQPDHCDLGRSGERRFRRSEKRRHPDAEPRQLT